MSGTQDAADRLAAAGISWTRHTLRQVARERGHSGPRVDLTESTAVLLTITGVTDNPDVTDAQSPVRIRLSAPVLQRFLSGLDSLLARAVETIRCTPFTEPNTMSLFGPVDDIALTLTGATWERTMFGRYTAPLSRELIQDLRTCMHVEHAMLILSGEDRHRSVRR